MKKKKTKSPRRFGHGILRNFLKIFIRKPKFVYLGEKIKSPSIILSNHVGKSAPLKLDLYLKTSFRFWGAHEMNEGLGSVYKYLSKTFYHEKQHWNLHAARAFCLIAAPLTYLYYRGLNLISTYQDHRLKRTIEESISTLKDGHSVLIFPEDSKDGYFDNLKAFYGGFATLANRCYKQGMDLPIYVSYFIKKKKTYIIDKPIMFSELIKEGFDRDKIAKDLCDRANSLQNIDLTKI